MKMSSTMSRETPPSEPRRQFLLSVGAGLTLALLHPHSAYATEQAEPGPATPAGLPEGASGTGMTPDQASVPAAPFAEPFVHIGLDSTVTVLSKHLDMGQGISSGLASIIAEEIDASHRQVRVIGAPADKALYANLIFKSQTTGGSTSTANSWQQMREAGATVRYLLVQAAAARWHVDPGTITISEGVVSDGQGQHATFGELAQAAGRLPLPAKVHPKPASDYKILGKQWPRLDSPAKTDGDAVFGIDVRRPGMKTALLARAPRFGATIRAGSQAVDDRAARQVPGVVDVVRIPNGVAVVADNFWAANIARQKLVIDWDETHAEKRSSAELIASFTDMSTSEDGLSCVKRGDAESVLKNAARVIDMRYTQPYLSHASMEPLTAVGEVNANGCEIWAGIQSQTANQAAVAKIMGLAPEAVKVNTLFAGGSFGRRASFDSDWIVGLAHILKATGGRYPVKFMWTREDDLTGGYYRPMNVHRIRAGLDRQGKLLAVQQTIVAQSFLFPPAKPGQKAIVDPTATEGSFVSDYLCPDAELKWINPAVGVPVQMFRGLGYNHTNVSKEVFADVLSRASGMDPLAFRLAHLPPDSPSSQVLELVANKAGWSAPFPSGTKRGDATGTVRRRGRGIAVVSANGSFVAQVIEVSVNGGIITVDRVVCAVLCGFVLNPDIVRQQLEGGVIFSLSNALYGEVTLDEGVVEQRNFNDYRLLRMPEAPKSIEVHFIVSDAAPTGIGEPGSLPTAAALINALVNATGQDLYSLPLAAVRNTEPA